MEHACMSDEHTGRSRGGIARAEKLTATERSEIARAAANARWANLGDISALPKATHDGVLDLGGIKIPCAVLSDGTRLLTQRGLYGAIGRSGGTGGWQGSGGDAHDLPRFLAPTNLKPFISKELECACQAIPFRPKRGSIAYGYNAETLIDICHVYLDAKEDDKLNSSQLGIAERCRTLSRALGKIGIVALVDEATGYQYERSRDELQEVFNAFLRKELAAWIQRFPEEFYREIFRLRGWEWKGMKVNRPQIVAYYTVDLVYSRLLPHIMEELESRMPRTESGRRKGKLHQLFSDDVGHPALAQHLYAIITLMRVAEDGDWEGFMRMVNRAHPKKTDKWLRELLQGDHGGSSMVKASSEPLPLLELMRAFPAETA